MSYLNSTGWWYASYLGLLHVTGEPSTEYVSDETPMRTYANLHTAFEQMRLCALSHIRGISVPPRDKSNWDPPRVLVVGPEHSGKTTVCKILTNYAVRTGQNWSPFLVNVDPSEVCHSKNSTFVGFSSTTLEGRLGFAWSPFCVTSPWTNTHRFACESLRIRRNDSPNGIDI